MTGTLVAVVLGGLISQGTAWAIETRREGREERGRQRAVRQATRMVHNELLDIGLDLAAALQKGGWWSRRADLVFEMPAWDNYADALAGSDLDDESWVSVANAYSEIRAVNERILRLQGVARMTQPDQRLKNIDFNDVVENVTGARKAVQIGITTLEDLMKNLV